MELMEYASMYGETAYLYEFFLGEKVECTVVPETFDEDCPF